MTNVCKAGLQVAGGKIVNGCWRRRSRRSAPWLCPPKRANTTPKKNQPRVRCYRLEWLPRGTYWRSPAKVRRHGTLYCSERRAVLFAQIFLLNLTHCVPRNVSGHKHALWLFVFCQITRDCRLNLFLVYSRIWFRSDDRHDGLAKVGVGNADDGAFGDARNRFDRGFEAAARRASDETLMETINRIIAKRLAENFRSGSCVTSIAMSTGAQLYER